MEALAIEPRSIRLMVITHGHWDHIGSASDIRKITGAKIAMHFREKDCLERSLRPLPPAVTLRGRFFQLFVKPLSRSYIPATTVDVMLGDQELSLTDYGIPGRILHTPGHSLGSVSVLLDRGDAFVGDLAMNRFPLRLRPGVPLPIFAEDMEKIKKSWRMLLAEGARIAYPAHGKAFPAQSLRSAVL